ncbi:MAG: hypothetical protein ACR2KK_24025 [Acidimicrobiales bacterium]
MTAFDVIQATATVLLGLLVVGLLKSHAEILRQLHELGAGREDNVGQPAPVDIARGPSTGTPAHDLAGQTPGGETAAVGVVGTGHDTLLAFLSSGCLTCAGFWTALAGRDLGLPPHMRVVSVTKSSGDESASEVRSLAPAGRTVLMSTQAWLDYEVPGSPYFVHVSGSTGRVAGEGTAATWEQVVSLVTRAHEDARTPRSGDTRIDQELMAAGILPGDPRLYPTSPPESGAGR